MTSCCSHVVCVARKVLFSTCTCFADGFLFIYPWRSKREQKPATTGLFDKPYLRVVVMLMIYLHAKIQINNSNNAVVIGLKTEVKLLFLSRGSIPWVANIPVYTSRIWRFTCVENKPARKRKCSNPFWLLHTEVSLHKLYSVSLKKTDHMFRSSDTQRGVICQIRTVISCSTLKMEAVRSFETLQPLYRTTWDYNPFGHDMHMVCNFIVSPGTAGLSPGMLESASTFRDSRSAQGHDKRYTLNLSSQEPRV